MRVEANVLLRDERRNLDVHVRLATDVEAYGNECFVLGELETVQGDTDDVAELLDRSGPNLINAMEALIQAYEREVNP